MKENRDVYIKVRMTETERQQLQEYAAAHGITMSALIRVLISNKIAEDSK